MNVVHVSVDMELGEPSLYYRIGSGTSRIEAPMLTLIALSMTERAVASGAAVLYDQTTTSRGPRISLVCGACWLECKGATRHKKTVLLMIKR